MVENHPTSWGKWGGRIHLPKSIGPALKICTKTTDQRMLCVAIRCTWQALFPKFHKYDIFRFHLGNSTGGAHRDEFCIIYMSGRLTSDEAHYLKLIQFFPTGA